MSCYLSFSRSANQVKFAPSNSQSQFHDWSHTGGAGKRQPDNREGGESCMAVLNNFYQVILTPPPKKCFNRKLKVWFSGYYGAILNPLNLNFCSIEYLKHESIFKTQLTSGNPSSFQCISFHICFSHVWHTTGGVAQNNHLCCSSQLMWFKI